MCEALKEMIEDATNEGMQQGIQEIARRMLKEGNFPVELIARMTNLTIDEVQALSAENA